MFPSQPTKGKQKIHCYPARTRHRDNAITTKRLRSLCLVMLCILVHSYSDTDMLKAVLAKESLSQYLGFCYTGLLQIQFQLSKKKKSNYLFLKLCEKMAINEFSYQLLAYWLELTSPLRFLN